MIFNKSEKNMKNFFPRPRKRKDLHKIHFVSLQIVLKEINRLGMLAEIRDLSEPSMMQVLNFAKAPLLVSNTVPSSTASPNITGTIPDHVLR
jgi:hypothetical protein